MLGEIQETDPDPDGSNPLTSPITTLQYDADGNVIAIIDPRGNTTHYAFDFRNRQISMTDATGAVTSDIYDVAGELVAETDPLSRTTLDVYDSMGRLALQATPDADGTGDPMARFTYDADGNRITSTDALGNKTQYFYNYLNELVKEQDPDPDGPVGPLASPLTTYTYDPDGNLVSQTDALGHVTNWTYDLEGRKTSETDPDPDGSGPAPAPVTQWSYDTFGNLLSMTDPDGRITSYAYDKLNRQVSETDPNGAVTSYGYNLDGSVTSVTDADGNVTSFQYDSLQRQIGESVTLTAGGTSSTISESFAYDSDGNLVRSADFDGHVIIFTYDAMNRETQEQWLDQNSAVIKTISYSYDADGELLSAGDKDGSGNLLSNDSFTYDNQGRIITESNAGTANTPTVSLGFSYDKDGNPLTQSETINGQASASTSFTYDALDRLVGETQVQGSTTEHVDFAYNALGQFTQISRFNNALETSPGPTSSFTYDGDNRLTSLVQQQGTAPPIASYGYVYDSASNIALQTAPNSSGTFTYDPNNELTSATGGTAASEAFSYDLEGNRTNLGYVTPANDNNRLQSDGTYTYVYDNDGNVISRTNIATGTVDLYTWDYRDRLTSVVTENSSSVVLSQEQYTYDVFDERISQTVTSNGTSTTERYDYVNGQLALVFNGSGSVQERYLYGPGTNQVLAVELGNGGAVHWFLTDDLGTVRDVTDSFGNVLDHLNVDPFGVVTGQSNPAYAPRFIFAGMQYDAATGLYLDGERYYNPAIGRFMSQDPTGFGGGDTNLYRYVGNDAPNMVDPNGLSPNRPDDNWYWQEMYARNPFEGVDGGQLGRGGNVTVGPTQYLPGGGQFSPFAPYSTSGVVNGVVADYNPRYGTWTAAYSNGQQSYLYFPVYGQLQIQDNYQQQAVSDLTTRAFGGLQVLGGVFQVVGGVGFAIATSWSGVGILGGGLFALKGLDNIIAGFTQEITGKPQQTFTYQALEYATGSSYYATLGNIGTDFILPSSAAAQGISALDREIVLFAASESRLNAIIKGADAEERALLAFRPSAATAARLEALATEKELEYEFRVTHTGTPYTEADTGKMIFPGRQPDGQLVRGFEDLPLVNVVDEFGHATYLKEGVPTIGSVRLTAANIEHHAQIFGEASANEALFSESEQEVLQRTELYLRRVLRNME